MEGAIEISYGRWNRREKRYSVIRCLGCQQPILVLPSFTSDGIVECDQCGKKQCVIYEVDHEAKQGQYRVLPGGG